MVRQTRAGSHMSRGSSTRRAFGLGLAAGLVLTSGLARAAESDGFFGQQAEWAQKYDADPKLEIQRSTTPVLSPQTVAATEQALQTYQGIVSRGGWNTVQTQETSPIRMIVTSPD